MALFNLVNFLILFWILKRYFFKPIVATIDERQAKAKESMDNFQRAKTELQLAEKRAQDIVDEAKVESNKIISKSHDDGKELGQNLRLRAKEEIEKVIDQAKQNIEVDRKKMREELKKETAGLVVSAVEKVIDTKLDKKSDEKIVKEAIVQL